MRARLPVLFVWMLWLTATVFIAVTLLYLAGQDRTVRDQVPIVELGSGLFIALALATVGAVVSARRSRNPIGWILLGSGLLLAVTFPLDVFARAAAAGFADPGLGRWAAWANPLTFIPFFGTLLVFLPLLFPDGRLLSPRWRVVAWVSGAAMAAWMLAEALRPGQLADHYPGLENPLPITAPEWLVNALEIIGGPLLFAPIIIAVGVNVVVRFRRSSGVARQQYKWVALPAALLIIFIPLNDLWFRDASGVLRVVGDIVFVVALGGLPVGVGLAAMRYRLYEIDRLVSRTVTYALVVGVLAAVFAALTIALPQAVGLPEENPLMVAVATLTAAALFNPLRRRVQDRVDRRFNRARYDAQQEVDRFSERLRTDLEIEDVAGVMLDVVAKTIEPSTASVWVKEPAP